MQQILTEESFSSPYLLKIICYVSAVILLMVGVSLLMIKDAGIEVVFLVPLIFLIAVSMLIHARLKLIISNTEIRFIGGLRPHNFSWANITKVDMNRYGKYNTPVATIYYSGRTLDLHRGFYLKPKFNRILSLLETNVDQVLFTEKYRDIRDQITNNI